MEAQVSISQLNFNKDKPGDIRKLLWFSTSYTTGVEGMGGLLVYPKGL